MDFLEKLILVDLNEDVVSAWREAFVDEPQVAFHHGGFEELEAYDCMVSAANSYGLMDGGVDLAISKFFGWELMDRVQAHIIDEWLGEQPVGTSFLIETGHELHPWLAHTPTMRVPRDIRGTENVYSAMFAMLRAVWRHNRVADRPIRTIACPGLGTATGRLPPDEAARQMHAAWLAAQDVPARITWDFARNRNNLVKPDWCSGVDGP